MAVGNVFLNIHLIMKKWKEAIKVGSLFFMLLWKDKVLKFGTINEKANKISKSLIHAPTKFPRHFATNI